MDYTILFYLGPILFCLIGIGLLFTGFLRTNRLKKWETTEATVIKSSRGILALLTPTVEYEVNNKNYIYTSNILQLPILSTGSEVTIFYHPTSPNRVVLDTFMQRGEIFKVIGGGFIIIGGLTIVMLFIILSSVN